MTTIALPPGVTPVIACPSWCAIPLEEHIRDLPNWEGMVLHWSAADSEGVRHSACAYPDGTLDPTDPPLVYLPASSDACGLDDAERLALAILSAVEEARR
ncbi:MAG: hypothetical protein WC642_06460 [Nocardioides sp.]|jgi:hypothetical protein